MNLVNLEAALVAHGARVVLDHVSLGVAAGDRIGVVGRNGSGKSTLLAVLAGTAELTGGRSTRARDVRIGHLPQSLSLAGPVRSVVFENLPEHEWAGDASVRALLTGLLAGIDLDAATERLSGGESRRVALAAVLRGQHDLLLLDEPTNHLDIEAIRWLASYLTGPPQATGGVGYRGALVVVTHDRWFLDAVSQRTWEIAGGLVRSYDGGYAAYVLARAERDRQSAALDQRRRNLLRKELAWLRRGPAARTSKPKFRLEAAAALIADEPAPRDTVELSRLAVARLGKIVIELDGVTAGVGDRTLLDEVTWQLGPGDRVGVVGVNGSGKTTLLNVLARPGDPGHRGLGGVPRPTECPPGQATAPAGQWLTGQVVTGKTVRLGYLTQEPAPVGEDLRVIEAAQQVRGLVRIGKRELSASQLLDRLGLRGDRQSAPVAELSGGERRRLQLQMVLMTEPNVLLLDEPTNDLDIDTLTELEDLLDGFGGSIVAVSHDQYFLERVTDHVLALADGKLAFLPGGVDEYLTLRAAGRAGRLDSLDGAVGRPAAAGARTGRSGRGPASLPESPSRTRDARSRDARSRDARSRDAKKELAKLDRQLAALAAKEADLHEELAAAAADYVRLIELGDDLRAVQAERAALEDRWLELAEQESG